MKNFAAPARLQLEIGGMLAVLFAACTCAPVHAQYLLIGGTQQADDSQYIYLGWLQPLGKARLGDGLYGIAVASRLGYDYPGSAGNTVQTRAPGLEAGLGYATTFGSRVTASFSLSAGFRNFAVSPLNQAARDTPEGAVWTLIPQLQWQRTLGDATQAQFIGNYSFGEQAYWTRGRLVHRLSTPLSLGLEAIQQGGVGYRIRQFGGYAARTLDHGWTLEAGGGGLSNTDQPATGYVSLAFSKTF